MISLPHDQLSKNIKLKEAPQDMILYFYLVHFVLNRVLNGARQWLGLFGARQDLEIASKGHDLSNTSIVALGEQSYIFSLLARVLSKLLQCLAKQSIPKIYFQLEHKQQPDDCKQWFQNYMLFLSLLTSKLRVRCS